MSEFILSVWKVLYQVPAFWTGFSIGFAFCLVFRTKFWRNLLLLTLFRHYRFGRGGALCRDGDAEEQKKRYCPNCIQWLHRSELTGNGCPLCGFRPDDPAPPPPAVLRKAVHPKGRH